MIDAFFNPKGVAVLGASTQPSKAEYQIVANMLDAGYRGSVYPVNPKGGEILGLKSFPSLDAIPGEVDLVVLAVSAGAVNSVLEDLKARGSRTTDIKAMIVVAAGFSETGTEEGMGAEKRLLGTCRSLGIRVLGPNCVGVMDTLSGVDTTFITGATREKGGISFVSQSGSVGAWLMQTWASGPCPMGFNKFVSVGNMADVDLVEILEYFCEDDSTRVVGLYLEGYLRGRALAHILRKITSKKPVVVLKVGRSKTGAEAAHSHTGSMAGQDRVYDGVLKQIGVRRVFSVEELSDTLKAFDKLPFIKGENVFLVTQAGGPGIYCTDVLSRLTNLGFSHISQQSKKVLIQALPSFAAVCRPEGYADVTAAASAKEQAKAVEVVLEDDAVDSAIFVTVPVLFVPPDEVASEIIQAVSRLKSKGINKPLLSVLLAGEAVSSARKSMEQNGLATFDSPDRAARALNHMAAYRRYRSRQTRARKGDGNLGADHG